MRWIFILFTLLSFTVSAQNAAVPSFLIDSVKLEGNKITRDNIIFRELEFTVGNTYEISKLDSLIIKSRQNLMNRSLFNFVTITPFFHGNKCTITVSVIERWYIWPIPIFSFADPNFNVWWQTKDFNRLNYGLNLKIENFRGRMENLYFTFQGGYDRILSVRWIIPYLTRKQIMGIALGGGYAFNHEVAYATVNNKFVFYNAGDEFARTAAFGQIDFTIRPKFNFLHSLSLSFHHINFVDTLLVLNPLFTTGKTTYDILSFKYQYKQDFRDSKQYPLNGYYFDVGFEKTGFGFIEKDIDFWTATFSFDQYFNIYRRIYFAYNLSAKYTNPDGQPFFLTQGLGLNGMEIRGYELYIVNGQQFAIFKSNLKYQIIKPTVREITWIKTQKFSKINFAFYANLFFDMGFASDILFDYQNPLSNQLLWGTGLGIDFVSYYDIVIRFEYGINKNRETGFFIGFVAPI